MRYTTNFRYLLVVLVGGVVGILITACNNDATFNSVNSDKATITNSNIQAIAVAVTDGVSASYSSQELNEIITALRTSIENSSSNTIAGTCAANAGTLTLPAGLPQSGTVSGTMTFNKFCLAGGNFTGDVVLDGDADFEMTYDQSALVTKLKMQVTNMTITEGGYTVAFSGTITQEGGQLSTTLTMDYTGSDGRQYQAVDLYKTGSYSVGYTVAGGTISDPDYGTVDIITKLQAPVMYNYCSNGKPISGSIIVSGSSSDTVQIDYDGCTQYVVYLTANSTGDTYLW